MSTVMHTGVASGGKETLAEKLRLTMRSSVMSVSLVTTCDEEGAFHGLAATSASSLTMEPPAMMVAVNRTASCHPVIGKSRKFCVNLLAASQTSVLENFSRSDRRALRFAGDAWRVGRLGLPYLDGAISNVFCEVDAAHDYGTHTVYFGRIVELIMPEAATGRQRSPLAWYQGKSACLSAVE
ncbi:flavin reductase family protein [Pseudochelatococcus lubricantis]|uniref:flavin reductase family protein n=1 Tax=Pseudochelatococcus lubricantis TaxID=1538102 RepID=UPI0035E71697